MAVLGVGLMALAVLILGPCFKSPDYAEIAHDTLTRRFGITGFSNWTVVEIAGETQGSAISRRHREVALQAELSAEELMQLREATEAFRATKFLHSPHDFSYWEHTNRLFEPSFFPSMRFATNWAPPPFRLMDYVELGKSDSSGYYSCRLYIQKRTNGAVVHALIVRGD